MTDLFQGSTPESFFGGISGEILREIPGEVRVRLLGGIREGITLVILITELKKLEESLKKFLDSLNVRIFLKECLVKFLKSTLSYPEGFFARIFEGILRKVPEIILGDIAEAINGEIFEVICKRIPGRILENF